MDPHAKEDIQKFKEKLEKIDKEMDKHSKMVLASSVDYYSIRDEYTVLSDK
jgi:hypothetical protein